MNDVNNGPLRNLNLYHDSDAAERRFQESQQERKFDDAFQEIKNKTVQMIKASPFRNRPYLNYRNMNNARLVVDKIGLACPIEFLNVEIASMLLSSNIVNFIHKGGYYFIMVHSEWRPDIHHHGVRVLYALYYLASMGAFKPDIAYEISRMVGNVGDDLAYASAVCAAYIWERFGLVEWEQAMDFKSFELVVQTNSNKEAADFRNVYGSLYSTQDYKQKMRAVNFVDEYGEQRSRAEVKEVQHSGLIFYQWDLKHGGSDHWYRMEFRFTNKYRADLFPELLVGGTAAANFMLNEAMARMLRNVTNPGNLIFNPVWINSNSPPWFANLLFQAQWFNPCLQMQTAPRRKGKNAA